MAHQPPSATTMASVPGWGHRPEPEADGAAGERALTRRLAATSVLLRSNFVPFERPDRLMRAMAASLPWGLGTAAGMAAACARYPEVNAVVDDDGAVTYGELWWRSDGLARRLVELGAGRRHGRRRAGPQPPRLRGDGGSGGQDRGRPGADEHRLRRTAAGRRGRRRGRRASSCTTTSWPRWPAPPPASRSSDDRAREAAATSGRAAPPDPPPGPHRHPHVGYHRPVRRARPAGPTSRPSKASAPCSSASRCAPSTWPWWRRRCSTPGA